MDTHSSWMKGASKNKSLIPCPHQGQLLAGPEQQESLFDREESASLYEITISTKDQFVVLTVTSLDVTSCSFASAYRTRNSCQYGNSPIGMGPIDGPSGSTRCYSFEDQQLDSTMIIWDFVTIKCVVVSVCLLSEWAYLDITNALTGQKVSHTS